MLIRFLVLASLSLSLAACGGDGTAALAGPPDAPAGAAQAPDGQADAGAAPGPPDADPPPTQNGGGPAGASDAPPDPLVLARPYALDVPSRYDPARPLPLVVLLHGYGSSAEEIDRWFGFARAAELRGVLVARPQGTVDRTGRRFWNATDACCDFGRSRVDDVAYLEAVVRDVRRRFRVDPRRVSFVGHSNGGFMAHRMACDAAEVVSAVASLAGAVWNDPSRCRPAAPVSVLQVHGDADAVVRYGGGPVLGGAARAPSAPEVAATWAANDGCTGGLAAAPERLDLDAGLPGRETRVARYRCRRGASELWTIEGGGHVPALRAPECALDVLDWLLAHPKD